MLSIKPHEDDPEVQRMHAEQKTLAAAVAFWESLDTPRSLGLALRLQHCGIRDVVKCGVSPRDYLDCESFSLDYAAHKFLAKVRDLVPSAELEEVALSKFQLAETKCASTNVRLFYGSPIGLESVLSAARRKIYRWIGEEPDIDSIVRRSKWGPGATATIKGDSVRPENKMLEPKLSVTSQLKRFAMAVVGRDLHWVKARLDSDTTEVVGPCTLLPSEFTPVDWMRVVTVEKDCKTRRTIGAEPTFNTWIQSGIGRELRSLLKRSGTNLDDQRINQTWAEYALSLGLATVDLEAASDSIAYWLVEKLLPPAWFRLLDATRSGYAKLPSGKIIALEKFSSMGNGYTFELESLIFRALAESVCEEVGETVVTVSVYGDDIIIPAAAYARLVEVFRLCGFSVNTEKSYADGVFYESCGEHYFGGVCVTPLYQKELLYGLPELVRSHNRVHRWCDRSPHGSVRLRAVTSLLRMWAGRGRVPRVPYGLEGDRGFWTTSLELPFMDGTVLCDVIEESGLIAPSLSDAALLAISLQRTVPEDHTAHLPSGRITWSTSSGCMVPLRGNGPWRVVRRWIPLTQAQYELSACTVGLEKVVDDWHGVRVLIPQLRFTAKL